MHTRIFISFIILFTLTGCATHYTDATISEPYGFFSGVWHGFSMIFVLFGKLIAFILSLVDITVFEEMQILGEPNTGTWYVIGYVIGVFICLCVFGILR